MWVVGLFLLAWVVLFWFTCCLLLFLVDFAIGVCYYAIVVCFVIWFGYFVYLATFLCLLTVFCGILAICFAWVAYLFCVVIGCYVFALL